MVRGTVMPRALAVLRLMNNSISVPCKDDLEKVRLICGTTCEPYKMLKDVIEGTQTY